MEMIVKCTIEKMAFPVDGYAYNVQELRSVDGGETFWYCGHGRYCRTLHEAEQYAESVDGTPRTAPRMFAIYKRDLIRTAEISGRPQKLRYNVIQHLCSFPGIDPAEMAASLQGDGFTILFDDSSISAKANAANRAAVNKAARRVAQ